MIQNRLAVSATRPFLTGLKSQYAPSQALPVHFSSWDRSNRPDITIIGGGIGGVTLAKELTKRARLFDQITPSYAA